MPVAKSYMGLAQIGEPYEINKRLYIKVKTKSGTTKQVRWYTESEFAKLYPELSSSTSSWSQKQALGFDKNFITIFKGNTEPWGNWLSDRGARYTRWWGWYFPSTIPLPDVLPEGITPIELSWNLIGNNTKLNPEDQVIKAVEELLCDDSSSQFIGTIGERIQISITVTNVVELKQTTYGPQYLFEMCDSNKNIYIWITSSNKFSKGETATIKGTVKEHKIYKNIRQTVLTRCAK